jgi:hypothetical protein
MCKNKICNSPLFPNLACFRCQPAALENCSSWYHVHTIWTLIMDFKSEP